MPSRPLEPGVWHGVQTVHWRHLLPIFFHPYRGYLGLHRRFGPVVRVSRPRGRRPFVFVADAPLAHKILVEYAEPIPRPENFIRTIFQATVGDNIVATRGEVWRRKRDRGTQRLKHSTLAQHHEALLGPCVDQLIAGIRREQQQGDALDLLPHIERYTLSAAMSLVSQTEVDPTSSAFEELLTAMRFIMSTTQHIADIRKQMFLFAAIPKARDYVDQGRYRSLKSAVETVAAFEPDPEARELFMAAYENPSTSLTWAMALLAQDARAQDALRREARQSLPHPLPYATATAQETIRLRPAIAYLARQVGDTDVTIDGLHLPRRTHLIIVPYCLHMDPTRWTDPTSFAPERFLAEHPPRLWSFGFGPRACVGTRLALQVLTTAISAVAREFEWTPIQGRSPKPPSGRFPWSEKIHCWVRMKPAAADLLPEDRGLLPTPPGPRPSMPRSRVGPGLS